jgi:hypothetical protein
MPDEMAEIPYSELKEFYYHARLVMLGGDFGEKDLARLYIAIEENSRIAGYWYEKVEILRAENRELLETHQEIINVLNDYAPGHFETSFTRARDMEELDE